MNCNATLTTLTPTGKVVTYLTRSGCGWSYWPDHVPDGATVTRDGDELQRDDVTVLTCFHAHPHPPDEPFHEALDDDGSIGTWCDDTPGATPHDEPMDELVAVSEQAGLYDDPCPNCKGTGWESWHGTEPFSRVGRDHCPTCGGSGTGPQTSEAKSYAVEVCPADECDECGGEMEVDCWHEEACARPHRFCPVCKPPSYWRPTVTDSEVFAAIDAYHDLTAPEYGTLEGPMKKMRRSLEAAARARQDNQDD